METTKNGASTLDRANIAADLLRFIGASMLAGLVTACVVAAVVVLLSGPGA